MNREKMIQRYVYNALLVLIAFVNIGYNNILRRNSQSLPGNTRDSVSAHAAMARTSQTAQCRARNGAKFNRSVVRSAAGVLQPGRACIAGIRAATAAASVNGPMSHGTRFRGSGLDTPGSAAGAVSGRYKRRRRPFPRHRQRSFTRERIRIYNNCIIIFLIIFPSHLVSPSLCTPIHSLGLTLSLSVTSVRDNDDQEIIIRYWVP